MRAVACQAQHREKLSGTCLVLSYALTREDEEDGKGSNVPLSLKEPFSCQLAQEVMDLIFQVWALAHHLHFCSEFIRDLLGSKTAPASRGDWKRNAAARCWSLTRGCRPSPGGRVIILTLTVSLDLGLAL